MKKDVFRAFVAFSFICIALISSAYLSDIKEKGKEEIKKIKKDEYSKTYVDGQENYGFNLPLVIIDTNGESIHPDKKITSDIQIYNSNQDLNYLTDEPELSSKINIKIRGNTTRTFPKKQYSLELINNKGEEINKSVLGMNKESDWILNGPFADKSLIRNYIVYKTSKDIVEYSPDVRLCEVFVINDGSEILKKEHYKGVYVMIEKIKRGEDRVDIVKSQKDTSETSFIISKDAQKENDISLGNYGKETYLYDYGININYPTKQLTREKYDYINKYMSEFERILYSDQFNDPYTGYKKYIDEDSFVDYFIINEFFKNTDAGILSTYLYKDYNDKLKAGPIWDFNSSLGNHSELIDIPFEASGFYMVDKVWFDRLLEDVSFANKVERRYKELRKTYLSDEYIIKLIDETVDYLGESINRNFNTWPIYMCNQPTMFKVKYDRLKEYEDNPQILDKFLSENQDMLRESNGKATSYEEEIKLMKNFVIQRGKWMDENIDSLSKWAD